MIKFLGGALLGFVTANIVNFVELTILLRVMKDVRRLLNEFKSEGKKDKWLG